MSYIRLFLLQIIQYTLLFTFSFSAIASNAWHPVGKAGAEKYYGSKALCESSESFTCYNTADCPIVYCDLVDVDGVMTMIENQSKKTAYLTAETTKRLMESAQVAAKAAMDCGKNVQALLLIRNASKNLTTAQIKLLVAAYADVKNLLDTGSLVSAKEEIQNAVADGVLVTEADKMALVGAINACLGIQ